MGHSSLDKSLYYAALVSLVMLLLVMLAGSIVRMSGSGMGCPDWPKCFGYYIPPTDVETLLWSPGREFKKGQMILHEEAFYVAKADFTAAEALQMANWERYTKHDYAHFDPMHTWIEFINRLIGALSGLPVLAFFLLSLFKFKDNPLYTILGAMGLLLLGFAAWLGKLVVDGNLIPHSITYHMFSALGLIAIFAFLSALLRPQRFAFPTLRDKRILALGFVCIGVLLLQIGLGTGVREEVDALSQAGVSNRSLWVDMLSFLFKVHRSFSIIVLTGIALLSIWIIQTRTVSTWPRVLLALVIIEILAGMGLAYLGMPAIVQPLHLMLAVLSFAVLILVLVTYYRRTNKA